MQVVVFWGLFLFVLPPLVVSLAAALGYEPHPSPYLRAIGVALFAVASALGLLSAFTMAVRGSGTPLPLDAPRTLVVTGPYAVVRNPMAVAGLAQGVAVALWHGSAAVLLYVAAGGVLWHVAVRPFEEADLLREFGPAFVEYRNRVRLWVPRRPSARFLQ
jgi:protein-S-isoprenylcysteine O-methyltransferase Ste14